VGSIPLDTPQEVFQTFGAPLAQYLFAMPDGEVGPRRHWISRVHYQVLAAHPELEVVQRAAPRARRERHRAAVSAPAGGRLVVQGQGGRHAGPLRRSGLAARICARRHQLLFRIQRDEGEGILPPHLRFQVSIPMVNSVLPPRIFRTATTSTRSAGLRGGDARGDRQDRREDPSSELAIQWDCSTEVQDSYGAIPGFPLEGAVERNLSEVRNLAPHIPTDVALGYHFCFGTLGGWRALHPTISARQ
jgi:hypothetical protein